MTASLLRAGGIRDCLPMPKVTTEIVGVVGNVLKDGLDRAPRPEIYLAHSEARGIGPNQPRRQDRQQSECVCPRASIDPP